MSFDRLWSFLVHIVFVENNLHFSSERLNLRSEICYPFVDFGFFTGIEFIANICNGHNRTRAGWMITEVTV